MFLGCGKDSARGGGSSVSSRPPARPALGVSSRRALLAAVLVGLSVFGLISGAHAYHHHLYSSAELVVEPASAPEGDSGTTEQTVTVRVTGQTAPVLYITLDIPHLYSTNNRGTDVTANSF